MKDTLQRSIKKSISRPMAFIYTQKKESIVLRNLDSFEKTLLSNEKFKEN